MRKTKRWTDDEEKLLRENYADSTLKELLQMFPDRTERSINRKAANMGLKKSAEAIRRMGYESAKIGYVDKYPYITKELLEDLYTNKRMSFNQIALKLGCSKTMVEKRLRKYGIQTRKGSNDFTEEERKQKWGRRGPDHPNWRGGITEVSNMIRNRVAHVSLEAFRRDGFKCVECGGGEHELQAHHIKPFSEIVTEIREENGLHDITSWEDKERLADICAEDDRLLDVSNLITLCEDCHYNKHKAMQVDAV